MYHDFISNVIAVLFSCGVVIWIDLTLNKKYAHYILGVIFGLITIFIIQDRIMIVEGRFYDFRLITMTLAGFIGGPVTAAIAAMISSLYRYNAGGSGSMGGIFSIVSFACFGSILGRHLRSNQNGVKVLFWFIIGIVMACISIFITVFIPPWTSDSAMFLKIVAVPCLVITPLATTITFNFYFWARDLFRGASILKTVIKRSPINLMIFDSHGPIMLSKNIKTDPKSSPLIENLFPLLYTDKTWQNTADLQHREIATDDGSNFVADLSRFQMSSGEYACLAIVNDVTDRRIAEEILRQSEDKFSKVFHGGPIMMALATVEEGQFIDVNEVLCSGTGYTRQELIGRTTKELDLFVDTGKQLEHGKRIIELGRSENIEVDFRTKSGEIRHGLSWSQLLYLDGRQCYITGLIDVTEQKRIQKEMARLDRLTLVGQFAAGIAHEVRNPMTTVRGYLQLLGAKPEYTARKSTFDLMISEIDRANSIITEFLSLAQTKPTELKSQNLNDILNNLYPLLEADTFTQNKQISFIPGEIPYLNLDEREISQLVLNLTRNGLEAMGERGSLTIKSYLKDSKVFLEIADEGCGIPPELISEVGTPFFTTKDTGTGLGLTTCYRIAESHNAKIHIDSSPNGTTFLILFSIPYMEQIEMIA